MTLDNLVGMSLERVDPDPFMIKRLIAAARRNIEDARLEALSNENRFDAAYKSIMQMANASLLACGYRTLTSKPGHHQTMIQTLPKTVGLDSDDVIVLDALRKQRNVADYSGDLVTYSAVVECIARAEQLAVKVTDWLRRERPELLE